MTEAVAKDTKFYIQNSGSPQSFLKVGHLTSVTPARSNITVEVTDYDDDHMRSLSSGVQDGSCQIVYNVTDGGNVGQDEMEAALADGDERTFKVSYDGSTPAVAKTFTAIVESISDAPGLKGVITKTAALKINSRMAAA